MKSRHAVLLAGMLLLALSGCAAGSPKPSPTPTPPFASADAAYQAAEATYRAYVDASNHLDLSNPRTFPPIYAWLLGDALDTDRTELTGMAAKGWQWSGSSRVVLVEPRTGKKAAARWGDVEVAGCLDVRAVSVTDADGRSVVSTSRPDIQAVRVTFTRDASTRTGMKIIKIKKREGEPKCAA